MGTVSEAIDDRLREWLEQQPLFVVATAPLAASGHVNCSPKGGAGSFQVLGPRQVAYLDLTGSGVETVAHLRENGRIVVMFCSFDRRPTIVRLHGRGRVVPADAPSDRAEFDALAAGFPVHPGIRSVIVIDVERVSESCGYAVPLMTYEADRDLLDRSADKRGHDGMVQYRAERNAVSIDGLPGLAGLPGLPD
jgi:predicted pyridoxine 5'-phosphate oxidase superfamily flavin-nucleotide-binding protein